MKRLLFALLLTLTGCTEYFEEEKSLASIQCTELDKKQYVYDFMHDAYFWHDKTPYLDYTQYPSAEALLEDLKYKPTDPNEPYDIWSYILSLETYNSYFNSGEYVGIGAQLYPEIGTGIYIRYVIPGSPAAVSGLDRGYLITQINAVDTSTIQTQDELDSALGESIVGTAIEVIATDLKGNSGSYQMVKEVIQVKSIISSNIYELTNGTKVGYFMLDRFIVPTEEELLGNNQSGSNKVDGIIHEFIQSGVQELIIDLRYNGGGVTSVARALANSLASSPDIYTANIFTQYIHNILYSGWNGADFLYYKQDAMNLDRLFVITTEETASASEQLIWALKPYMNVITLGTNTHGKPYGMYVNTFCEDEVLIPIQFQMQNSDGNSWSTDGITPTCKIAEDEKTPFGDLKDPLYSAAINYLETEISTGTGNCSTASISAKVSQKPNAIKKKKFTFTGFRRELRLY